LPLSLLLVVVVEEDDDDGITDITLTISAAKRNKGKDPRSRRIFDIIISFCVTTDNLDDGWGGRLQDMVSGLGSFSLRGCGNPSKCRILGDPYFCETRSNIQIIFTQN
jgi:hypothetical protein